MNTDLTLHVDSDVIKPVSVVRDLGVLLDQVDRGLCLSMKQHISKVTSTCFYQLRRLKQVRRILGQGITTRLFTAFISSRMDYCKAVLAGLPKSTLAPLQRVQNAAARLILGISPNDHVTPALQQLRWLPITYQIIYKLSILKHLVHTGRSPTYLSSLYCYI